MTMLHQAVLEKNQKRVTLLLKHGKSDVNAINEDYKTPLYVAVESLCDISLIKTLLAYNADVNRGMLSASDSVQWTPLHIGVKLSRVEIVQELLKHGANPNIKDHKGQTPVFQCTRIKIFQLLVEHGADLRVKDEETHTVLFNFMRLSYLHNESYEHGLVNELLGVDPDISADVEDGTILMYAVSFLYSLQVKEQVREGLNILQHFLKLHCLGKVSDKLLKDHQCFTNAKNFTNFKKILLEEMDFIIEDYEEKCRLELEKLNDIKICNGVTLKKFLCISDNSRLIRISNGHEELFLDSQSVERKFPIYSILIKQKFKYARDLESVYLSSKSSLLKIIHNHIDTDSNSFDLAIDKILDYLLEEDLKNLSKAI